MISPKVFRTYKIQCVERVQGNEYGGTPILRLHIDNDTLLFKNGSKLYVGLRAGRSLRSVWVNFVMNKEGSK